MKKALALFLMIVANFILLAHAVIPHHHHDEVACFTFPIEEHHGHECEHHDTGNKHDDDCDGDCCLLNDLLAIIPDGYKHDDLIFSILKDDHASSDILVNVYLSIQSKPLNKAAKTMRYRPYLAKLLPSAAGHGIGLRAPPSC